MASHLYFCYCIILLLSYLADKVCYVPLCSIVMPFKYRICNVVSVTSHRKQRSQIHDWRLQLTMMLALVKFDRGLTRPAQHCRCCEAATSLARMLLSQEQTLALVSLSCEL